MPFRLFEAFFFLFISILFFLSLKSSTIFQHCLSCCARLLWLRATVFNFFVSLLASELQKSLFSTRREYERSAGCFEFTYFLPSIHKPLVSIPSFRQCHRHPNEPGSTAEQICHSVLRNDATLLISSRSSQQQRREKATAVNNTSDKVLM